MGVPYSPRDLRAAVPRSAATCRACEVTTGLIAVAGRLIDSHAVHHVALLPPEGSWCWLDQRAAFAAALSVGGRKLGRAGGPRASVYMVPAGTNDGRESELTQISFWNLSSSWRSWLDLERDVPRLVELDMSELGAPQVTGRRVWEVVDEHVE